MINPNFLAEQLITSGDSELSQRLGLYQVFLRLYEQNRGLLDEILNLEKNQGKGLTKALLPYIQGLVLNDSAYLITNLLGNETQTLTQPQNIWTIGRDSSQMVLPIRDSRLSRCHAAIEYVKDVGFYLIDLGSRNGSFVNGEIIRHPTAINDGDQIRLGSLAFTFFQCSTTKTLPEINPQLLQRIHCGDIAPTTPLIADSGSEQLAAELDLQLNADLEQDVPLDDTSMFIRHRSLL